MRLLCGIGVTVLCGAVALAGGRVETSDARLLEGDVLGISADQVVLKTAEGKQSLPAEQVIEITFAEADDAMNRPGQRVVVTALGDRLAVRDLASDGKSLRAESPLLGQIDLPVEAARRIYLPDSDRTCRGIEERCQEMKLPAASGDRLIVAKKGNQTLAVDGVLEEIGPKTVTFRWKDESRQVARETLWMIDLAAVGTEAPPQRGIFLGRDGSVLHFTALALAEKSITLTSATVGRRTVGLDQAAGIRFTPDSVVNLATLKPAAIREYGYFDTTFPHRLDRSVAGGPLRLGGRTYRTGLGLHSYCELLYQLGREYSAFVATVGIDDAVRPNGDATVTFLGDGRPLAKPLRVTGKTAPQPVHLKIEGIEAFLIRVDFGDDGLGFSDHVDLGGARLLK